MKGLLLKDIFTLYRQAKIFVLLIVVFAVTPGYSMSAIAVMYAAMLPITALAYDERAHWGELAAMMPYTPFDLVFSKYALGYVCVLGASLLSALARLAVALVKHSGLDGEVFVSLILTALTACVILGVNLPVMFRIGVEKGRIAFFVLIATFVAGATLLPDAVISKLSVMDNNALVLLAALALTAAVSAVSVALSVKLYRRCSA